MTDDQLDAKLAEIVTQLREALRESAALAHDLQRSREALAEIGRAAPQLVLREQDALGSGGRPVDPWPTHAELLSLLRRELRLQEHIAELRGSLRQMGLGPELFGSE